MRGWITFTVLVLFLFLLPTPVFGQSADVPLTWDANPVEDDVAIYRIYRAPSCGGLFVEIAQVLVTDPLAVPIYTDPAVDFAGGLEHCYVVTAQNIPGLESGFSDPLRVKLPQVPRKLKINRRP